MVGHQINRSAKRLLSKVEFYNRDESWRTLIIVKHNKITSFAVRLQIYTMKKLLFAFVFIFGTAFVFGQKYAYIDSDFILASVPEYKEAKDKLDKLADRWTKEIEERYEVLKLKKDNFAREEVLLPNEEKTKRKEEIAKLETEAMEMQKLRFGVGGDYFQKDRN